MEYDEKDFARTVTMASDIERLKGLTIELLAVVQMIIAIDDAGPGELDVRSWGRCVDAARAAVAKARKR